MGQTGDERYPFMEQAQEHGRGKTDNHADAGCKEKPFNDAEKKD
jgi:hypothetical protein